MATRKKTKKEKEKVEQEEKEKERAEQEFNSPKDRIQSCAPARSGNYRLHVNKGMMKADTTIGMTKLMSLMKSNAFNGLSLISVWSPRVMVQQECIGRLGACGKRNARHILSLSILILPA